MPDGVFGPATDKKLREHLKREKVNPDDDSALNLVEKITGKSRIEARKYIKDAQK